VAEQSARESYRLTITAAGDGSGGPALVDIDAATTLGLRHALRTLANLVSAGASSAGSGGHGASLPVLTIQDRPRFGYRGLILDTAHHFLTVKALIRTVRLLGRLKYNVLHWHPTDTQAFQLVLPSHPELAKASTAPGESYSLADVKAVVAAGRLEGVSVLVEVETPGHASSWEHSHPELALVGPTDGVAPHPSPSGKSYTKCPEGKGNLDPTNEGLYKVRCTTCSCRALHACAYYRAVVGSPSDGWVCLNATLLIG
jgi:N-acetyl-beta-hexosaminidase